MNKLLSKFFVLVGLTFSFSNLYSQGADVCGTGIQLLAPSGNTIAADTFEFNTSLTPTPTAQDPNNFYYTSTSVNQIFVDREICRDIWYKIQVPASGGLTIDLIALAGFEDDFAMALYGSCSGAPIASADDYYEETDFFLEPSITVGCLTPGSFVYLRIWQYGCDDFDLPSFLTINVYDQANTIYFSPGDNTINAVTLPNTLGKTTTAGTLTTEFNPLMSPSFGQSTCTDAGYSPPGGCADRWYKIALPASKILNISLQNSVSYPDLDPNNFTMQLFTGQPCSLNEYACGSDIVNPKINDIAFDKDTTVYVRIFDQYCDQFGEYELVSQITARNFNDDPCTALSLTLGAASVRDTLLLATPSSNIPNGNCAGLGSSCRDLWFTSTAPADGTMTVNFQVNSNLGASPNGLYVTAYKASTCTGTLTTLTCKSSTTTDSLKVTVESGDIVYIRVMDYNCDTTAHQDFSISTKFLITPSNDEVCNAIVLNSIDTIGGTIINATQSATLPNPTCNYTTANTCEDVWYAYTFTEVGTFEIKTVYVSGTNTTTNIAQYTDSDGDPCNGSAFTQIACATSSGGTTLIDCIEGNVGDTYYFRMFDLNCDNNNRRFNVITNFTGVGNSHPCGALTLDFGPIEDTVEFCKVLISPVGTPNPVGCGFSSLANCENKWFSTTVPNSGTVVINLNMDSPGATTSDLGIQGYQDSDSDPCNGGLSLVGTCSNGNAAFDKTFTGLVPGSLLYLRVWDFSCDGFGDFTIGTNSNNNVLLTAAVDGTTINLA